MKRVLTPLSGPLYRDPFIGTFIGSFHDTWRNNIPDSLFNNIITMPYSAVVTYGALLDGPLSIQLAVYR